MIANYASYLKTKDFQQNYLFGVVFSNIPNSSITGVKDLTCLARSSSIPKISNEFEIINTHDNRFTIPKRIKIDHEWNVKLLVEQNFDLFNSFVQWYKNSQLGDQVLYKIDKVDFLMLDKNINVTNVITLQGVYPISIPELDEFNYENTDGITTMTVNFSFDDIDYDSSNRYLPEYLTFKTTYLSSVLNPILNF